MESGESTGWASPEALQCTPDTGGVRECFSTTACMHGLMLCDNTDAEALGCDSDQLNASRTLAPAAE